MSLSLITKLGPLITVKFVIITAVFCDWSLSVWHSPFKLYLYPDTSDICIDEKIIASLLEKKQLIGSKIAGDRYATGNEFLSLLTFMGCSPDIEIEPQDDKPFCYIEISKNKVTQFIAGKNTKSAPCPHCKIGIQSIPDPEEKSMICPACNGSIETRKLNWRKSAFVAKSWIRIGNIYELEAIPSDELLTALAEETGVKWKAAYIRSDLDIE